LRAFWYIVRLNAGIGCFDIVFKVFGLKLFTDADVSKKKTLNEKDAHCLKNKINTNFYRPFFSLARKKW
jgi:hypothetical protein